MTLYPVDRQNVLAALPGSNNDFYDLSPVAVPISIPPGISALLLGYTFDPGANNFTLLLTGALQLAGSWVYFPPLTSSFTANSGRQSVGSTYPLGGPPSSTRIERVLASIVDLSTNLPPTTPPKTIGLFKPPASFGTTSQSTVSPATAPPTVSFVTPAVTSPQGGGNTVSVLLTITGTNFDSTASVKAMGQSGAPNIALTSVSVTSPNRLTGIFTGSYGGYDIVVTTNSGGSSAINAGDQFTVT